jgi:aldose 1-epimerase
MKAAIAALAMATVLAPLGVARAADARVEPFGVTHDGRAVPSVVLTNARGFKARIVAWGAALQELDVPDWAGRPADVVLSYPDMAGFETGSAYFGATVGRYANRIANARFSLDGHSYTLNANDGLNTLHAGPVGFDKAIWTVGAIRRGPVASATFSHTSPDGDQGFPGALTVEVTYALDDAGTLTLTYAARTTRPTVVNLTNHSYFNLAGVASGRGVLDQRLMVAADAYTPSDPHRIPSGELRPVAGTDFDFRTAHPVGENIRDAKDPQLMAARGYDHNFVLRGGETSTPKLAARMEDPVSRRVLEMSTTEPGLQVYSANFLDGRTLGKDHLVYRQSDGLALEAQHFPDSPNHPEFPTTRLDPGQTYRQVTVYRFTTLP